MTARILCLSASLLGATVGACLPASSKNNDSAAQSATSKNITAPAADVALEIALNQFPGGYQSRWAQNAVSCSDSSEASQAVMSLQGRLIKLPEGIGTMMQGKRMTSKTMEAEFDFVGKDGKSTRAMSFKLTDDRKHLIRTDLADGLRTRYVRCPKLMAG